MRASPTVKPLKGIYGRGNSFFYSAIHFLNRLVSLFHETSATYSLLEPCIVMVCGCVVFSALIHSLRKIMSQANTRTDIHEAVLAAHTAAFNAASLFGEHHKLKDGKRYNDPAPEISTGRPVVHGVIGRSLDFIPLSTLVVGAKLKTQCQCAMKPANVGEIRKLMNKSFFSNKDWRVGEVRVSVMSFMEKILGFLSRYGNQMEAYVAIYDNKDKYTDVFGLVIMSKSTDCHDRLTWEITIDDAELVPPLSIRGLFCRN